MPSDVSDAWSLPAVSLDTIAALSPRGAALRDAVVAANMSTLHHPLIAGLFLVYTTLCRLSWFRDHEVAWPPHESPAFDEEHWRDLGFDEEVIRILPFLPYVDWYDGQMAPDAAFITYVNTDERTARDIMVSDDSYMHPWTFRFTDGGAEGYHYVYDTRDGTYNTKVFEPYAYNCSFLTQPGFPTEDIMRVWLENMYRLKYIPNGTLGWIQVEAVATMQQRPIDDKGSVTLPTPDEITAALLDDEKKLQENNWGVHCRLSHRINELRARKNIALTHGWPRSDFREYEYSSAQSTFEARANELHSEMDDAAPLDLQGSWQAHPAYIEPEKVYSRFLTETAGDLAV
ncbi:hypothetical protein B9Z65_1879 [Elsinoe australis]|uniref:Uncharacterized protein n=1 Tax=Elsinoe australis TaxID=40998 RepID=A0A2P7YL47_9PEZI|nr:hypothetical protein B9Z65_1879 [Elsinoe australis]